ncbi:MAG: transcriptional repressor LexA [Bifidobacteriaceae bacterium]|jgi:repressor LexA|nr:transcriptional repressor LexA [Bifidobacteriaceae bacterium]
MDKAKRKYPKTTKRGLTPRQRHILQVIKENLERRGYAPSMREIGTAVGLTSPSSVKHQLEVLEAKGYLRRDHRLPRAMEVIDPNADVPQLRRPEGEEESKPRYVPLVERVAAGTPVLSGQEIEALYPLPRELTGEGEVFLLRVRDDSMSGAAINLGDLVVVRRQPRAENGQIVAAQIGDETTVKIFDSTGARLWLRPDNPTHQPIEGHKARVLGPVTCVIRTL